MTDRACVTGCRRPTADFLCAGCVAELVGALRELPGLLAELDITLSCQDKLVAPGAAGRRPLVVLC
jgi:hypothetical protein